MNRSPWRLEEVDGSPWRLEEVDGGDEQYPVESRFAVRHTPPDEQDPRFDRRRSVSSVLRMPDPSRSTGPRSERRRSISSVVRYARPRFHCLFRPSPPDEHDDAFRSDPAGWLPMNTTTTLFLRSDPAMYVCASRRLRPCPYVRMWPYFLSCTLATVRTCTCYVRASTTTRARLYYDTCVPLLRHVRASTSSSMYVHVRDQNDNATYASTRWVPTVRHFLACEDVAGGSQQSGGMFLSRP